MADEPIKIAFDPSRMTFREMALFEDIAGVPVGSLGNVTVPTAAMLVAITYLEMRRADPTLTVDAVWDMNIEEVDFADPTEAAPTPLLPLEQPATTRRAKAS